LKDFIPVAENSYVAILTYSYDNGQALKIVS